MTKNEILKRLYQVEAGTLELSDVLKDLEQDVYIGSFKDSEKQCHAAMKRCLKSAQKDGLNARSLHGYKNFEINGINYQMVTDSFRLYGKKGTPFKDLPETDPEAGKFPDVTRIFVKHPKDKIRLTLEQVNRAKTKPRDDLPYPVIIAETENGARIGFNADYVKDALMVLGVSEFDFDCTGPLSPAQGETGQGFALLVPVRLPKD